jgi:hypothetical protein
MRKKMLEEITRVKSKEEEMSRKYHANRHFDRHCATELE